MNERHRFMTAEEDYRPVKFPPPGPFWCTGYALFQNKQGDIYDKAIIVAILPKGTDLKEYWPEAEGVVTEEQDEISYTDRFPKPDWLP